MKTALRELEVPKEKPQSPVGQGLLLLVLEQPVKRYGDLHDDSSVTGEIPVDYYLSR